MSILVNGSVGITFPDGTVQTTAASGSGTVTGVTAVSPLTSSGGTTPAISLSGIVPVANGGTGVATLTGIPYFNGTSAITAATGAQVATLLGTTPVGTATNIAGGAANQIPVQSAAGTTTFVPAPTIGSTILSWDGSAFSWVSQAGSTLTIGTGLSGTSYNGSAPVTIAIANSGVTAGSYGSSTTVPVITVNAQGQITAASSINIVGGLNYQGAWNANTNTPALASGTGTNGYYYIVSVAGTTNLDGITDWQVGDWAIFDGTTWQKIDNTQTDVLAQLTVTSLTGYMYANGSGLVTASTTIPTTALTGILAPANGGTGVANTATLTITGANKTLDQDVSSGASPTFVGTNITGVAAAGIAGGTTGQIPVQTGVGATGFITAPTVANTALEWDGANFVWSAVTGTTTNALTAGTGLDTTPAATTFNGSAAVTFKIADTAVTPNSYGAADKVGTFTVNQQGQLTAAADVSIAIAASQVTSGILAPARGGTGVANTSTLTITGANQTLDQDVSSGASPDFDGTNFSGAATSLTAGKADNIVGGAAGSLPYQTNTDVTGLLAIGSTGDVLTVSAGGLPSWAPAGAAANLSGGAALEVVYQTAPNTTGFVAAPTVTNSALIYDGTTLAWGSPVATTATNLAGGAAGSFPYQSAAGTTSFLAAGTAGQVITSGGAGAPTWTNGSVTINGTSVALGASGTITANTTNALSAGTGLDTTPAASTFNGSAAVTIKLADTAVTTGTYGSATTIPRITVDQQGRITSATEVATIDLAYQGTWNAATNTPPLADGTGTQGDYYVCNVAGTQNLGSGNLTFNIGDWAIYDGTVWELVNNSQSTSVSDFTITGISANQVLLGGGTNPIYGAGFGTAGQVLTSAGAGLAPTWAAAGTVSTVSVVSANGFAGTVATATTTPAITLSTTVTGILQGNGTAISAATTTGTNDVVLSTTPTIATPVMSSYVDMTPIAGPAYLEGRVFYDTNAKSLNYYNDNNQMSVNLGQEQIIRVRNQTGSIVPNGTVVYINGAAANAPTIALAQANTFNTSDIIGVTTTDINNNGFGYVTVSGVVNGLDTSTLTAGDRLFVSPTTPGGYTTTEPTTPNFSVQVGVVTVVDGSAGAILVAPQLISVEVSHIVGTVGISQGGTGQTTASAAFNALSPVTTTGDLIIGNGANSSTRLPIGTNGYVLTSNGTTATWAASSATNVNLSAGAGATNYIPFATGATGSQALTTDTSLTYNVTNHAITSGINGGTF